MTRAPSLHARTTCPDPWSPSRHTTTVSGLDEEDGQQNVLRHWRDGVSGADAGDRSLRTRAGTLAGRTIPAPRTVAVMAGTNVGLDWLEFSPSDNAQQLSASACVSTRSNPERCESSLCIGHSQPSTQQAIRASGVGIHPAQIASFPAIRANVSARAAKRWASLTTPLGCSDRRGPVKRMVSKR